MDLVITKKSSAVVGFSFAGLEGPISTEGIGYVAHPYPGKFKNPADWNAKWTKDWGFMSEKYPQIFTEIGFQFAHEAGGYDPITGTAEYVSGITGYCAACGISCTVWCFDPHWVPKLISDWNFTPTLSGELFRQAILKKLPPTAATEQNRTIIADQD